MSEIEMEYLFIGAFILIAAAGVGFAVIHQMLWWLAKYLLKRAEKMQSLGAVPVARDHLLRAMKCWRFSLPIRSGKVNYRADLTTLQKISAKIAELMPEEDVRQCALGLIAITEDISEAALGLHSGKVNIKVAAGWTDRLKELQVCRRRLITLAQLQVTSEGEEEKTGTRAISREG